MLAVGQIRAYAGVELLLPSPMNFLLVPVLVAMCGCALPALAAEQTLASALAEGRWTYRGPKSILGRGSDTTIAMKREGDHWSITYEITHYPSVNEREAKPTIERKGPYPVAVEDRELVIKTEKGEERYTFLCDQRRLILPAFVQKKPGEWAFRCFDGTMREDFSVRCEHDPFQVPVGKAQIPGVLLGKGFYSFEEAPRSGNWPSAQYLRFLERSDQKGELWERFRLIFDDYGWPRYERLLSTGERSRDMYQLRLYVAS